MEERSGRPKKVRRGIIGVIFGLVVCDVVGHGRWWRISGDGCCRDAMREGCRLR